MSEQPYLTIAKTASAEITIERSRFIGHCDLAPDENAAKDFISKIRAAHAQANHNCYAYRIGQGDYPLEYFNDHGEPAGTAGKPILGAIQRLGLTNTVVVVTRYFGGKKLGVRGLIEAYGTAASLVLETAGSALKTPRFQVTIEYNYPEHNQVLYRFGQIEAIVLDSLFTTIVTTRFQIPEKNRTAFNEIVASSPFIRIIDSESQ